MCIYGASRLESITTASIPRSSAAWNGNHGKRTICSISITSSSCSIISCSTSSIVPPPVCNIATKTYRGWHTTQTFPPACVRADIPPAINSLVSNSSNPSVIPHLPPSAMILKIKAGIALGAKPVVGINRIELRVAIGIKFYNLYCCCHKIQAPAYMHWLPSCWHLQSPEIPDYRKSRSLASRSCWDQEKSSYYRCR